MYRVLSANYILNKFVLGHAAFFLEVFQKFSFFYKSKEIGTDFSFSFWNDAEHILLSS